MTSTGLPPSVATALTLVFGAVPPVVRSGAFALVCNHLFRDARRQGDLEFLRDRTLRIRVRDLGLDWCITLTEGGLRAAHHREADVRIEADCMDFLLLAGGREDPDTLLFSRHLCLQGDTELGLYLKNFLDAQEPPPLVRMLLRRLADRFAPPDQGDGQAGVATLERAAMAGPSARTECREPRASNRRNRVHRQAPAGLPVPARSGRDVADSGESFPRSGGYAGPVD